MERSGRHEAGCAASIPAGTSSWAGTPSAQSWEQIFANTRWLRVTPTAVDGTVIGDVGLVVCSENITATTDGDVGVAVAQATNVFRRTARGGG